MAFGGSQTVEQPAGGGVISVYAPADPLISASAATQPFPFLDALTLIVLMLLVVLNLYLTALVQKKWLRSDQVGLSRMQKATPATLVPSEPDEIRRMLHELREHLDRIEQRLPPRGYSDRATVSPAHFRPEVIPNDPDKEIQPSKVYRDAKPSAKSSAVLSPEVLSHLEKWGRSIELMPYNSPELAELSKSGVLHYFFITQAGELRLLGKDEWVRDKQWMFGIEDQDSGHMMLFFDRGLANQRLNIQHDPLLFSKRLEQVFDIEINQSGTPRVVSPAVITVDGNRPVVLKRGRGSF